jgi:hypothetical protein
VFHVKHESTRSRRFFWWSAKDLTFRWRPLYWGTEENCNRTFGVRVPGGVVFVCLNIPLRQTPHEKCST